MRRPTRAVYVSLFALACAPPPSACGLSPRWGEKISSAARHLPRWGENILSAARHLPGGGEHLGMWWLELCEQALARVCLSVAQLDRSGSRRWRAPPLCLRHLPPAGGENFERCAVSPREGENIWVCGGWSCVNRPWRAFAFRWRNWMGAVVVAGVRAPLCLRHLPPAGGENSERCVAPSPGGGENFERCAASPPAGEKIG